MKGLARLMTSLWDSTAAATRMQKVISDCSAWCMEREKELKSIHIYNSSSLAFFFLLFFVFDQN